MKIKSNALAAFLILAPSLALAHALTVNFADQPPKVALAHNGSFDPIPKTRITQVVGADVRGRPLAMTATDSGNGTALAVSGRAPIGAVWVSYLGAPSGVTATGERRPGPIGTHADAINVGRSQVYALTIKNAATPLSTLPTGRIALVPVTPLSRARVGTTLRVKAIYAGTPLANTSMNLQALTVEQAGETVTTNSNGEADIVLSTAGRRLFAIARVETPSSDASVDTLRLQATLGFDVLPAR